MNNWLPAEFWANLGPGAKIIIVLILCITAVAVVAVKRLAGKIDKAVSSADLAADLSKPTGNGYAVHTMSALDRLMRGQDRIEDSIDRLRRDDHIMRGRLDRLERPGFGVTDGRGQE